MDAMDRLIAAIDKSGLKHIRIAEAAGMRPGKFSKIYKRRQVPTILEYIAIARAIRVDPALLFTQGELAVSLQKVNEALTGVEQAATILRSWVPQSPENSAVVPLTKPTPRREGPVVEAAANSNAELLVEYEPERKRIPRDAWNRKAKMIARVRGDSMDGGDDPIRDGELAYLKPTRSPRTANGHVALVRRGDALYLKLFEISGHTIRLVSANREHADVVIDARAENVQVFGYVVAHRPER
jgi:SOS-response transcriptional repressor LexA